MAELSGWENVNFSSVWEKPEGTVVGTDLVAEEEVEEEDPFSIDIESVASMRVSLSRNNTHYQDVVEEKAKLRRHLVSVLVPAKTDAVREYEREEGKRFIEAKLAGEKVTEKLAASVVAQDPSMEPFRQKVEAASLAIDLCKIEIDRLDDTKHNHDSHAKNIHKLLEDMYDEKIRA